MEEKEVVKFISNIFISAGEGISPIEPEFFIGKVRRYVKNAIKDNASAMFTGRREAIEFLENAGVLYKLAWNISDVSLEDSSWKAAFESYGSKREVAVDIKDIANREFNLLVHGKAGSGKTAILQRIMLLSLCGRRIPVLIDLRENPEKETSIADFIVSYIIEKFDIGKFPKAASLVYKMLSNGEFFLLCDGLECAAPDTSKKFAEFSEEYSGSRFVVTRRTAYKEALKGFTNVEVVGFGEEQIKQFVNAWFKDKPEVAKSFLVKMSDACYESQKLCSIPLFLGMLCLVFDENMDFPVSSAELCEAGVTLLLRTWHGYEKGSSLYRHMPVKRKLDMFSKIAYRSFISGRRALHKDELESEISGFIEKLPQRNNLKPDLYEFIRTVESEHGILVRQGKKHFFQSPFLQEYLAAKHILSSEMCVAETALKLAEPAWREIFLLTASMLPSGEKFFRNMQEYAGSLSDGKEKILTWAEEKRNQAKAPYPPASVRAFYVSMNFYFLFPELYDCVCETAEILGLSRCIDVDLTKEFNISRTGKFVIVLNLDRELLFLVNELSSSASAVNYAAFTALHGKDYTEYLDERLALCVNMALRLNEFEFIAELYALKRRIPTDKSSTEEWGSFRSDLRDAALEYRNVCIDFETKIANIRPYLYANKTLAECMNMECCISPEVRKNLTTASVACV